MRAYHIAIQFYYLLLNKTPSMNLRKIILHESSQTQRITYNMTPHIQLQKKCVQIISLLQVNIVVLLEGKKW